MKNLFFNIALDRASRLIGKPGRLLKLLAQLAPKLARTDWRGINTNIFTEKINMLGRMVKAFVSGSYKPRSMKLLITLLAAILYFLNPFDLIPDFILGVGLTDDLAVLMWVFHTAREEVNAFLEWEDNQRTRIEI